MKRDDEVKGIKERKTEVIYMTYHTTFDEPCACFVVQHLLYVMVRDI
jgi:hypothetical protein